MEQILKKLRDEVPPIINGEHNGAQVIFREHYLLDDFLRTSISVTGPITRHRIKLEITREETIGPYSSIKISQTYDYPVFNVTTYTLDNILAEKLRALIERTKIRDYYDTWRLLQLDSIDHPTVKQLFYEKCKGKGLNFKGIEQFFPQDLLTSLQPYYDTELTRLTADPPPPLHILLEQLRNNLEDFISD